MRYDITFHPSWWHKNAGVDFTQEFFDDPRYRIECDVRMRKTLYEHFGDYRIGERSQRDVRFWAQTCWQQGICILRYWAAGYASRQINSPQVECLNLDEDAIGEVKVPNLDESPVWAGIQKQMDYLKENIRLCGDLCEPHGIQIAMDLMGQEVLLSYYTAPGRWKLCWKRYQFSLEVGKRFYRLSSAFQGE